MQCGFTCSWYMEEEIRKHLGEGFGRRGWLVVQDLRRQMYNLARKLDDEDFQMRKKAQELEELLQSQQAVEKESEAHLDKKLQAHRRL